MIAEENRTEVRARIEHIITEAYGSMHFYRYRFLGLTYILTDMVYEIIELAEAHWLIDVITSVRSFRSKDRIMSWNITVDEHSRAVITAIDLKRDEATASDAPILYRQDVGATDFPLPSLTLWAQWTEGDLMILLPSEY